MGMDEAIGTASRLRRGALAAALLAGLAALGALLIGGPGAGARGIQPVASTEVAELPGGETAVFTAAAPGVSDQLYIVAQEGTIYRLNLNEPDATPQPFLEIDDSLLSTGGERGLLSVAFRPDFDTSGALYVYFTNARGNIEVDEYLTADNLTADPQSRRRVIVVPHPDFANHNGGTAMFGPDGLLYLGTGDGGAGGDPRENAQNRNSLLGKLLRINPRPAGDRPYTSPRSNPFFGKRRGRGEIFALGLRNPFRYSFDGPIAWIGDVGQNRFEEVDRANPATLRGANFGWDRWEGNHRYRDPGDPSAATPKAPDHDRPYFEYRHSPGCSITGGVVAPPSAPAAIAGRYVYADFCESELRSLPTDGTAGGDRLEGLTIGNPTSFGIGPDGEVYVTRLGGQVLRLVDAPN